LPLPFRLRSLVTGFGHETRIILIDPQRGEIIEDIARAVHTMTAVRRSINSDTRFHITTPRLSIKRLG
jgi:hypothetical protein